jgi:hypothetical protein
MTKAPLSIDLDEDAILDHTSPINLSAVINEDGGAEEAVVDEDGALDRLPKEARRNDDGTVTLTLHYPQKISSKKEGKIRERLFETLTFHRLTGRDQRAIASATDDMQTVVALAQSAKLNQAVMNALYEKMDMADITNCGRVLNHFLTNGPATGR